VTKLLLDPNLDDADAFYAALIDAHRDLDAAASADLNARLILLLANQIGRRDVLLEAIALARSSVLEKRDEEMDQLSDP
jgi:hypothetical protein